MVGISRSRTLLTPCKFQGNYIIQLLLNQCHKKMPFIFSNLKGTILFIIVLYLSNDPGKVDNNFFCYAATVLSPHRNVLIFTQRMHKPT